MKPDDFVPTGLYIKRINKTINNGDPRPIS